MDQLLTVIVQTSPIPSHPSTALLEALFRSFRRVDGLLECKILIVCDGCETITHTDIENMKHGKVTSTRASRYKEHLCRLRQKVQSNEPPFCPQTTTSTTQQRQQLQGSIEIVELQERHGSARAIETVFHEYVETPFVMIAQHDNFFVADVPLRSILMELHHHDDNTYYDWVKAIHFPATATLNYRSKVKHRYGIDIESKRLTKDLSLTPLVFWYGRTHVGRSDYYREFVLSKEYHRTLQVGDHLEELWGEAQLRDILQHGMDAHEKYGNYIINWGESVADNQPGGKQEEEVVLYHLSGRRARAVEVEEEDTNEKDSPTTAIEEERERADHDDDSLVPHKVVVQAKNSCGGGSDPIAKSFTTARSWRAIVPGLTLLPTNASAAAKHKAHKGRFKQKCFHCGVKGHSFRFCPERSAPPETQTIDLT